jgi:tripartite-type tricarboxylate transporter receptor subunit TctC
VLQILHGAIAAASEDAEFTEKIRAQGITPRNIGLGDFDAHIRKDMERLEPLLKTIARAN